MIGWYIRLRLKSFNKKAAAMMRHRQSNAVSDVVLQKEVALYYKIARIYDKYKRHKKFPYGRECALEAYRAAAGLNDVNAQYTVGQRLLENGKFWDTFHNTAYECNAHKKYATDAYTEAFVYLDAAEASGHALAKRLKGLAYINGWGKPKDSEHGYSLVVDSIDLENSWGRATKIFEELHLNKSDFFSSIMSIRQSRTAQKK